MVSDFHQKNKIHLLFENISTLVSSLFYIFTIKNTRNTEFQLTMQAIEFRINIFCMNNYQFIHATVPS